MKLFIDSFQIEADKHKLKYLYSLDCDDVIKRQGEDIVSKTAEYIAEIFSENFSIDYEMLKALLEQYLTEYIHYRILSDKETLNLETITKNFSLKEIENGYSTSDKYTSLKTTLNSNFRKILKDFEDGICTDVLLVISDNCVQKNEGKILVRCKVSDEEILRNILYYYAKLPFGSNVDFSKYSYDKYTNLLSKLYIYNLSDDFQGMINNYLLESVFHFNSISLALENINLLKEKYCKNNLYSTLSHDKKNVFLSLNLNEIDARVYMGSMIDRLIPIIGTVCRTFPVFSQKNYLEKLFSDFENNIGLNLEEWLINKRKESIIIGECVCPLSVTLLKAVCKENEIDLKKFDKKLSDSPLYIFKRRNKRDTVFVNNKNIIEDKFNIAPSILLSVFKEVDENPFNLRNAKKLDEITGKNIIKNLTRNIEEYTNRSFKGYSLSSNDEFERNYFILNDFKK